MGFFECMMSQTLSSTHVTIDVLPNNVLLETFEFYLDKDDIDQIDFSYDYDGWQTLVHMYHRWRCIVFASPRCYDPGHVRLPFSFLISFLFSCHLTLLSHDHWTAVSPDSYLGHQCAIIPLFSFSCITDSF